MKIQVAGPGCLNCRTTEKRVYSACAELGLDADIAHIFNIAEYVSLGVTRTPAVIVDGKILVSGRVPTVPELVSLLAARD